jgi:Flp pilus assembly secretin CpaC
VSRARRLSPWSSLVDDSKKVVSGIAVHGRDQVMLKVTVAEVQRDVISPDKDQGEISDLGK